MSRLVRARHAHVAVISACIIPIALSVATTALFGQSVQTDQKVPPSQGWADTVFINGKIATMNDAQRFVNALAIRDSRITAVGTKAEIEKFAGPQTKVFDLKGKTVVPGLITGHDHPQLWFSWFHDTGSKLNRQWERINAIGKTPEEAAASILRTIERTVQQRKPKEWIMIRTNEGGELAILNKSITEAQLDKVAPHNPVLVSSEIVDFGISKRGKVLSNAEAMRRAYQGFGPPLRSAARNMILNFQAQQTLRSSGMLDGPNATNNATGVTAAVMTQFISDAVGLDALGEALQREMQFWVETQGVTTILTTWFQEPDILTAFSRLARQKKLPARLGWYTSVGSITAGSEEGIGDPFLWNVGVEFEGVTTEGAHAFERDPSLWGTEIAGALTYAGSIPLVNSRLEKIRADYFHDALSALPGDPGREAILKWLRQGVRVGDVHCRSDGAIDMFIGILKQLQNETGWSDQKIREMRNFYLTHNFLIRPDQIPELKKWGMIVGPSWRPLHELIGLKIAFGREGEKYIWPIKSLLEAGIPVSVNMDMSPTLGPEGEGVWDLLEFLIDREYAGEVWNKAEAVDRWSALKTLTIYGAYNGLREHELGSLERGKLADLVVLDKDYFSVPAKEISTIKPLLTVVGGRVIYQCYPTCNDDRFHSSLLLPPQQGVDNGRWSRNNGSRK